MSNTTTNEISEDQMDGTCDSPDKRMDHFDVSVLENGYVVSIGYQYNTTGEYYNRRIYIQSLDELQRVI